MSDFGKLFFENDLDEPHPPNTRNVTVEHDHMNAKFLSTPRTAREIYPERCPRKDGLCDGTGTYPRIELDAQMTSDQLNFNPTNFRSRKHDLSKA